MAVGQADRLARCGIGPIRVFLGWKAAVDARTDPDEDSRRDIEDRQE